MWWVRRIYFILVRIIIAPCLVLGGMFFVFLPFGFATMQDPDKPLSWSEYLGVVWRGGSESFVIGLAMIIFGVLIAGWRHPGATAKSS